jgi:hypothetical protein
VSVANWMRLRHWLAGRPLASARTDLRMGAARPASRLRLQLVAVRQGESGQLAEHRWAHALARLAWRRHELVSQRAAWWEEAICCGLM